MLRVVPWVIVIGILPYLAAVLMPGRRTLAVSVLLIGGGFTALWMQHFIAMQSPGYKEGPGGAIGIALVTIATTAFATGVVVRALSLIVAGLGWSFGRVFAINTFGFPIVIAVFVVPGLWNAWRMRPPSAACVKATFELKLADGHVRVPASSLFNVYLGPSSARDAYYFGILPNLRAFCDLTRNGAQPTRAANITLDLGYNHYLSAVDCADPALVDDANACAALPAIKRGRIDDTDYPIKAYLFAPNDVVLGEFLGTRSTYDDSMNGHEIRNEYFHSQRMTPDGKPLTFACTPQTAGYYCRAAYAWRDGGHLDLEFRAGRAELVSKGERVEATTRAWFERMRGP